MCVCIVSNFFAFVARKFTRGAHPYWEKQWQLPSWYTENWCNFAGFYKKSWISVDISVEDIVVHQCLQENPRFWWAFLWKTKSFTNFYKKTQGFGGYFSGRRSPHLTVVEFIRFHWNPMKSLPGQELDVCGSASNIVYKGRLPSVTLLAWCSRWWVVFARPVVGFCCNFHGRKAGVSIQSQSLAESLVVLSSGLTWAGSDARSSLRLPESIESWSSSLSRSSSMLEPSDISGEFDAKIGARKLNACASFSRQTWGLAILRPRRSIFFAIFVTGSCHR